MKCTQCQAVIPDGSNSCPSCGKNPMAELAQCSNCGKELTPGQQFCPNCGTAVPLGGTTSSTNGNEDSRPYTPPIGFSPTKKAAPASALAQGISGQKRNSLLWLGIPFGLLFVVFGVLYLFGTSGWTSWVVMVVCLALIFFFREKLMTLGLPLLGGVWVIMAVVFFVTLGLTAQTSTESVKIANAGNGEKGTATTQTRTANPTSGAAGLMANTPLAKTTSVSASTEKTPTPTPYKYKGEPPEALKPLIAALGKPTESVTYDLTVDGDQSSASLYIRVNGGTVTMYNLMGDTSWDGLIVFYAKEDYAKRNLESQLKSDRENEKANDERLKEAWNPITESKLGKGDDGYALIRTNKDQPLYAMKSYGVQQGKVYIYVGTHEDTQNPVIAGDGIDILLAELKKVDINSLFTVLSTQGSSTATATGAKATATVPLTASSVKVQNMAVGSAINQEQKIVNPTTVFKTDTPEIMMSVEFTNVTKETTVDVQWVYLGTNEVVPVPTEKLSQDQRKSYSLSKPTKGFPTGEFKVVVLIDGKEAGSTTFSVK